MRETSRLPGSTINSNTHVDHIADTTEEVIKVAVCHLEGHVANEESLGGRVHGFVGAFAATTPFAHLAGLEGGVLHGEAAALEELLVKGLDCFGGCLGGFEVDVAESEVC